MGIVSEYRQRTHTGAESTLQNRTMLVDINRRHALTGNGLSFSHRCLPIIRRRDCVYTKCYCEENIYRLCLTLAKQPAFKHCQLHVCIISNDYKQVLKGLRRHIISSHIDIKK